jgi:hypothetical protein
MLSPLMYLDDLELAEINLERSEVKCYLALWINVSALYNLHLCDIQIYKI